MKEKRFYVYFLTNERNTVIYVGITNNLPRRIAEHKNGINPKSFTCRYNVYKLVHYEVYSNPGVAINREKRLKGSSRKTKEEIIKKHNPRLIDLCRYHHEKRH